MSWSIYNLERAWTLLPLTLESSMVKSEKKVLPLCLGSRLEGVEAVTTDFKDVICCVQKPGRMGVAPWGTLTYPWKEMDNSPKSRRGAKKCMCSDECWVITSPWNNSKKWPIYFAC